MNEDQKNQLLGSMAALCRALGADLAPAEDVKRQTLRGMAFMLGRLLKTPERCRGLAGLACREYLGDA